MNTKNLVLLALLVGVGAALYVVMPGIVGGMKPDMMLVMMFIGIILFPNARDTFLLAISTGIISGLLTTFPGGFIPNIVDKAVTGFVFLIIVLLLKKFTQKIAIGTILTALGTIISGTVFLGVALFIMNTDVGVGFTALFVGVVLPAVAFNCVAFIIMYPIIVTLAKRSKFIPNTKHA